MYGSSPQWCFISGQSFGRREREESIHLEKEDHMERDVCTDQLKYLSSFYVLYFLFSPKEENLWLLMEVKYMPRGNVLVSFI